MVSLLSYLRKSVFVRNFATYMTGGILSKAISFCTFIYIGKLLSPDLYAQFTLFIVAVGFLSIFVSLGLPSGMLRIIWEDSRIVLTNSIIILIFFSIIQSFFIFFFSELVIDLLPSIYHFLSYFKIFICIKIFVTAIVSVLSSFYVSIEQPQKFVKFNIFSVTVTLLLLITINNVGTCFKGTDVLWVVICAHTVAGLISVCFGIYLSREYIQLSSISFSTSIRILKETIVYFFKNLIGFMQMYSSKIVLSIMATNYLLGVYSFYMDMLVQLSFLTGIFDKVYIPKIRNLTLSLEQKKRQHAFFLINKTAKTYALISIPFFIVVGPILYFLKINSTSFDQIIQTAYLENLSLFYFMFFAWLIGNIRSFFSIWQYVQDSRVNKHIIFIHVIVLIAMYVGAIFFYNILGIYGIVVSQILIYLLFLGYSYLCYKKFVVIPAAI